MLLRKDYLILTEYLEVIHGDMRDWTKVTDKEVRKVYYKKEKNLKTLTIYLEGIIEAPLLSQIALIAEVDLFKKWAPLTKKSNQLEEISHMRKMCYILLDFPWPFSNREVYF